MKRRAPRSGDRPDFVAGQHAIGPGAFAAKSERLLDGAVTVTGHRKACLASRSRLYPSDFHQRPSLLTYRTQCQPGLTGPFPSDGCRLGLYRSQIGAGSRWSGQARHDGVGESIPSAPGTGQSRALRRRAIGSVPPLLMHRGDRGAGTSARFLTWSKQGGRRGPRSRMQIALRAKHFEPLLRGPRRPPFFLHVKILS
jgi:hypothetical protein